MGEEPTDAPEASVAEAADAVASAADGDRRSRVGAVPPAAPLITAAAAVTRACTSATVSAPPVA